MQKVQEQDRNQLGRFTYLRSEIDKRGKYILPICGTPKKTENGDKQFPIALKLTETELLEMPFENFTKFLECMEIFVNDDAGETCDDNNLKNVIKAGRQLSSTGVCGPCDAAQQDIINCRYGKFMQKVQEQDRNQLGRFTYLRSEIDKRGKYILPICGTPKKTENGDKQFPIALKLTETELLEMPFENFTKFLECMEIFVNDDAGETCDDNNLKNVIKAGRQLSSTGECGPCDAAQRDIINCRYRKFVEMVMLQTKDKQSKFLELEKKKMILRINKRKTEKTDQ